MRSLRDPDCMRELVPRLQRIRPDTPRRWGRMNAPQMICHLKDCFLSAMGDRPMEIPSGFSVWQVLKYVALYAPVRWPQGVHTRPDFDQLAGGGTPPAEFETDVRNLLAAMEKFAGQPRTFQIRMHPMFKKMSEAEWMRWGYLHVDHHLRQFGQ